MHKPTLIKMLKFAKGFAPEDPQISEAMIRHMLARAKAEDPSLDPAKLLAGANIQLPSL